MASFFSPVSRTTTAAICSSSNLLEVTLTQHLASHPTSASLLTTFSPLPSPPIVTSHPDQKGLTPFLALLLVSIRDALLTTYAPLPSHLSVGSHHEYLKLSHTHQIILNSKNFYCRNGVLAMNIINTASAPHQRCQNPTKGALLLAQAKWTRNTSSVSSYRRSSSPSDVLLSVTRPTPHKTVLGNLTTCWHLASRSATPNNITQHLALFLC